MAKLEMKNNTYDKTKPVATIWLPALATLYSALAVIWGFPYGEEVVGSIVALNLFVGAVLGVSSKNYHEYKDGTFVVDYTDPDKDTVSFELAIPVEEMLEKNELKFHVRDDSQQNHGL